ncbi:helicase associated domain-containing protein [Streptomyces sp. NPDC005500]|uniref:helicase associated domain-containing protein n=1 Tax=Streptomyces sp. NPDC005500 TaxID=3155007 RepID=UPI0033BEAFB7
MEMLAIPQEGQKRVVDPSQTIGPEPEDGEEELRLLLRFAAPRDPVMIAKWIKFQILDTERQDWTRGYDTARRYFDREGTLDVPYEHAEGARWAGGCPTKGAPTGPGPCPAPAQTSSRNSA